MSGLKIECWENVATQELEISIKVPSPYVIMGKRTRLSIAMAESIDMTQFFGMLEDAVCMKLGIEPPRTDKRGHNAKG